MGLGDHPEKFLLKALWTQGSPSWLKVVGGWWWPWGFYCHLLGLGVLSIPISQAQAQCQLLDNNWSKRVELRLVLCRANKCSHKIDLYDDIDVNYEQSVNSKTS